MKAYPFWIIRRHNPVDGIEYRAQTKWVTNVMDAKIFTNRSIGGGWHRYGKRRIATPAGWLVEKIPVEIRTLKRGK